MVPKRIRRNGTKFLVIISESFWKMTICFFDVKGFYSAASKELENVLRHCEPHYNSGKYSRSTDKLLAKSPKN